ncbi:hypothetical protein M0R04_09695 [Candidatus Dojkabacteria bacterium]|jgi:hypothetical protein|nr:hypothetical protein [Candidatus Dojkabacteria bacterium]
MNKEKMLKKLQKKAMRVSQVNLQKEQYKEVTFEAFVQLRGKLYFDEATQTYYKLDKGAWYCYKVLPVETKGYEQAVYAWLEELKGYVQKEVARIDTEIKELKDQQEIVIAELVKYTHLLVAKHREELHGTI